MEQSKTQQQDYDTNQQTEMVKGLASNLLQMHRPDFSHLRDFIDRWGIMEQLYPGSTDSGIDPQKAKEDFANFLNIILKLGISLNKNTEKQEKALLELTSEMREYFCREVSELMLEGDLSNTALFSNKKLLQQTLFDTLYENR